MIAQPKEEWGTIQGAKDEIAAKRQRGEPLPSTYTGSPWIRSSRQFPPAKFSAKDRDRIGKWLIFSPHSKVDLEWTLIEQAHRAGVMGIDAKVSSSMMMNADGTHVICVYTKDWQDEEDVFRVRTKLRRLGFTRVLYYKRDIDTRAGKYHAPGQKVSVYSE